MNRVKEYVTGEMTYLRNPDRRLEMAADALAWAIRWFFHMWVCRGYRRWGTYRAWKKNLKTWTMQKAHDSYKHGFSRFNQDLPKKTVEGVEWLVDRWFGITLSEREKGQLEKMLEPKNDETEVLLFP